MHEQSIMEKNTLKISLLKKIVIWAQILLQIAFPLLVLPAHASSGPGATETDMSDASTLSASLASSAAQNGADAMKNTATHLATTHAASTVEEWLSHFGTAQVTLDVDDNGNWDNSAFDFLAPLYDNKKSVLFTQLGIRAPDGRTTGNIGLGVRTFYVRDWMFGGNVFFDDDFTGENRRIGFGAEAWTNYLKLSANTYIGTSQWHNSGDFDNYNEKPADGYDVRAEGYLPSFPQLGAKLMYEQYYGDNVALFDKDHLQSNPSAVTVGLNYTPVPLITAGIDYKRGQDSMDEMKFSLNFHYALDSSWQSQISPEQVATRRSLAGSRYDLVDRNNEIILQYKKKATSKAVADMTLATIKNNSPADGTSADTVTLHAVTADGKPAAHAAIVWTVSGNAALSNTNSVTDANGNTSVNLTNTTAGQVIVTATSGSVVRTTSAAFNLLVANLDLVVTKDNSIADGTDQNAAQVQVKDASGKGLSGVAISWKVGNGATIVSSDKATNSSGVATIHLSSTTPGAIKLSASAGNKTDSVNSTFVSQTVAAVAVTMTTNNSPADGSTANVAQALVTSASGQPMAGVSVTWNVGTATATTPLTVTTNASGIATVSLTDTTAETVAVIASAGGKSGSASAVFTAVPVNDVAVTMTTNNSPADGSTVNVAQALVTSASGQPMPGVSVTWNVGTATASAGGKSGSASAAFTAVPVNDVAVTMTTNNSPADGNTANVAQALVTSASGQPMPGVSVTWNVGTATATTPLNVTTNAIGVATVSLTDTTAEAITVSATAGGKTGSAIAVFSVVPVSSVAVTITTNNSPADGSTANVAQALVTSASGQPMPGVSVTWNVGTATATTPLTVTTDASGLATVSLTDTTAETVAVIASAGGKSGNASATFTSVSLKAVSVSLSSVGRGNAADPGITTALVKDINGNPVAGATVIWSNPANGFIHCNSGQSVTDAQGQATQTCYAVSGNVFGFSTTVTVDPQDTVDPSTPVTATNTRDYLL
ncbi:inverse autotransporter beta domain-containing protein [Cronobacter sakazakii]|nr:inverse autotransporter beta domain-containing protein [Cronobacter sakazakii]ELY6308631.1 inverse autotransporter beta domain-containing protein [Cronobacter sakazakii]